MNKNIIYYILMLILMVGCERGHKNNHTKQNKKVFKKAYYPSGAIFSYGFYLKDSIPTDTIHEFFENGRPSSILIYDTNGTLNGTSTYYFKNGNKSQLNSYLHGKLQGFFAFVGVAVVK